MHVEFITIGTEFFKLKIDRKSRRGKIVFISDSTEDLPKTILIFAKDGKAKYNFLFSLDFTVQKQKNNKTIVTRAYNKIKGKFYINEEKNSKRKRFIELPSKIVRNIEIEGITRQATIYSVFTTPVWRGEYTTLHRLDIPSYLELLPTDTIEQLVEKIQTVLTNKDVLRIL